MEPVIINEYLYNRGRGVELRTSRITVNDLWPYLQHADYSDAQMLEIWPITQAQLDALKEYITVNRDVVAEENAKIDATIARERAEQEAKETMKKGWWNQSRMRAFLKWRLTQKNRPIDFSLELRQFRESQEDIGELVGAVR